MPWCALIPPSCLTVWASRAVPRPSLEIFRFGEYCETARGTEIDFLTIHSPWQGWGLVVIDREARKSLLWETNHPLVDMLAWFVNVDLSLQAVVDMATIDRGLLVTMIYIGVVVDELEHEHQGVS